MQVLLGPAISFKISQIHERHIGHIYAGCQIFSHVRKKYGHRGIVLTTAHWTTCFANNEPTRHLGFPIQSTGFLHE